MKPSLLGVLRCPICFGNLQLDRAFPPSCVWLQEGTLVCARCSRSYPIIDGIPRILDDSLPGMREKRREIEGWANIAREKGWYTPSDEVDRVLPFTNRDLGWNDPVWGANEYSFSLLLDNYIRPGMKVLEVGAAKCWGAQHLIPRGCEYVGTDTLADPNIGLGRGAFYAQRVGEFDRVQADGERLPFVTWSFDLTYCAATLHHALTLPKMVREMARVTRPGGFVVALNEGTRPRQMSEDNPLQDEEKRFGINEHVHTIWEYVGAFLRAGLVPQRLERSDGYRILAKHPVAVRFLRLPRGKIWSTIYASHCVDYGGVSLFGWKAGTWRLKSIAKNALD